MQVSARRTKEIFAVKKIYSEEVACSEDQRNFARRSETRIIDVRSMQCCLPLTGEIPLLAISVFLAVEEDG